MMLALGAKEVGSNPTDPSDGAITLPTFRSLVLPHFHLRWYTN
jgi:hypothetical protein